MKSTLFALTLSCLLTAATGAAASATTDTTTDTAVAKAARPTLEVGMSAEQIVQLAGSPARVKKIKRAEINAEVWSYTFSKPVGTEMVATRTQDVPYVDPFTGVMKMLKEPVQSLQRTYLVETTELLMIDAKLAQAKRYRTVSRNFD